MKWMTYAIGLLFVLFTLQGVLAVEQNLSDYYNVTTSGDIACFSECKSYIYVTKTQDTKPSDNFNTDIEFEFQNTKFTRKVTNGKNVFTGRFDRQNIGYDIYLKTGETCNNQTVIYENGTEGTETYCQDNLIPFDMSTFLFSVKDTGQTGTIVLMGQKGTQDTVKWGITIGDIYIDPFWYTEIGYPAFYSNSRDLHVLDSAGDAYGLHFVLQENITTAEVSFAGATSSGDPPYVTVGFQYSNGTPNGTWVGGTYSNTTDGTSSSWRTRTLVVNLTAGTPYWFVVEYSNGNNTNYTRPLMGTKDGGEFAFSVPEFTNGSLKVANKSNGGAWTNGTTTPYRIGNMMIKRNDSTYFGVDDVHVTNGVTNTTILAQNFSFNTTITVSAFRMKVQATSGEHKYNVFFVNTSQTNSSWGNYIMSYCEANITTTIPDDISFWCNQTTTFLASTTYSFVVGTNSSSSNSIYVHNTNRVGIEFTGNASWGTRRFSMRSSTNNGTSWTDVTYADIPFGMTFSEPTGSINTTLSSPNTDSNMSQNQWNTFSINITCTGGPCGDAYAYLDPYEITNKKEEVLWCELPRLYSSA